ncbi:MAG: hypothetical protein A2X05_06255 [Bacteroidetes bacterium GWE2_41_25]|nr:MAG: hypothetical protein A2X03_11765 [Bacteroidetes bacterium GWA2_40_15]OFX83884.1 MAG: hypothetical protein A2X06_14135 [Bacteroidetes bacterium GWC2_40_22]OFX99017.1 MAG: hypothetical protein A2X05_06255 [Bacteroidetes bacterium GWE2_41_25]OFY58490.1 MAG: hypothetical protein A2X04_13675 [Bacteroidetes bacterium GWF2_41_9]HBH83671.1 hypothetical protein [Bacteroidales bacterium]
MEKNEKKKIGGINSDVIVFAFFLLLAFSLWYLNDLGKETEADIRYPVRFVNIPKGRVLSDDVPLRINLYLKGPGFSILKLKYTGKKTPVTIDLSKVTYRRVPESKGPDYYILTSVLSKSITVQLRTDCDVTSIKPDTLFITLGKGDINSGGSRK